MMTAKSGTLGRLLAIGRRSDPSFDRRILSLAALSLVSAIVEVAALASLVPLLSLVSNGNTKAPFAADIFRDNPLGLVLIFATLVGAAAMSRLALASSIQRRVLQIGHSINVAIQQRLLVQPYLFHASQNSSRFVAALQKTDLLTLGVMGPLIQGLAGLAIGSAILVFLLFTIDWRITLSAAVVLGGAYLLLSRFAARRLKARGEMSVQAYEDQVQLLLESSGAIRDILLDHRQRTFAEAFARVSEQLTRARAGTDFLNQSPRFIVEAIGAIAIAGLAALIAARDGSIAASLPLFGLLALAMVRIVPLAQTAYRGWAMLSAHKRAIDDVGELLHLPPSIENGGQLKPLPFERSIEFHGVCFAYPKVSVPVLEGASFTIKRGEWLGLSGATGAGKSTIGDLALGLLTPDAGEIRIDDHLLRGDAVQRWQRSVAHVSQSVYLLDDTIAANIALAPREAGIDLARIANCAAIAQLEDWVEGLPDRWQTLVGERGGRLSGGQRQRIGIARALYKNAPFLMLDEATNALDTDTEAALLDAIRKNRPETTLLMISHRIAALKRCDRILVVEGGRLAPA
ncbi:ABC transporter ATP-binding protein [Sphingomonas sp. HDW15A]|uniref:ABC transporter ATP-binding protein n=1 Tax=Sphingomonas sp. HDW15A TaxID=2714942 RepID=UPI00140C7403|nr:ABC transporter ATP-binding protein [Sphingomonas sp. HDW15A]QIK96137.1 ABC transporter ATP-binding protein [Sphingomonas sp. HDW15A]